MERHIPDNLIRALRRIRLTGEEKASMKKTLFSHMRATPMSARKSAVPSPYHFTFRQPAFVKPLVSGLVAMLVVLSTGTAAALGAEGTLPGDFLYPIKTRVTEPLLRAFYVADSIQERANYEWSLVEKRLDEAERLAREKRLERQAGKITEAILAQRVKALRTAREFLSDESAATVPPATASKRALSPRVEQAPEGETSGIKPKLKPTQDERSAGNRTEATLPIQIQSMTRTEQKKPLEAHRDTDTAREARGRETAAPNIEKVASPAHRLAPAMEGGSKAYTDAVKKIDTLFEEHRGVVEALGLSAELQDKEKPHKKN